MTTMTTETAIQLQVSRHQQTLTTMTTETAIQIQVSRHQQTLVDTSRQIVTWTAFAILAMFVLTLEKFARAQKYFFVIHVTNSMSAMHTFSSCNDNDENAGVYFLIELQDILTLLLYGVDMYLLWGLTKHI